MKIDRVLISLNNNKNYTKFWNIVAPIWKEKFGFKPTLIFIGTQDEFESNNFNLDYDVIQIEVSEMRGNRWGIPWSLFWLATQFPDDVCLTCGVDQIPLNYDFFDYIKDIDNEKFIVGLSDAYLNYKVGTLSYFNTKSNILYPTGHNVALGRNFKKIFNIEDNLSDELNKVYLTKDDFHLPSDLWGIDECYFSDVISNYINKQEIELLDYYKFFGKKRLYNMSNLDSDLLDSGYYSEFTNKENSIELLKKIINLRYK